MNLSLSAHHDLRFELRQELQIDGGLTLTVLPMSERWLRESSDHQNAVKMVRAKHAEGRFRSLMDYLFANVFPGAYSLVKAYYDGEGPKLAALANEHELYLLDSMLVETLKLAYEDFCEDRIRSWSKIRKTTEGRFLRVLLMGFAA